MPQAFLGSNPGTTIEDASEPELQDDTAVTTSATGAWVEVNYAWDAVAVVDIGAVTGTSVLIDIEVQGADDAAALNLVSFGKFDTIDESSDGEKRVLHLGGLKAFMRVDVVVAGSTPSGVIPVHIRPAGHWQGNTISA